MTIEEAYEEIGLAPGVPAGEIRRAYLRQLKTRKPEVDPEGFHRLRQAYEILSDLFPEEEPERTATFAAPFTPVVSTSSPEPAAEPAQLSPQTVFRRLLELHAHGKLAEAAALEASFRERLHASGRELDLLDDELAIRWSVVQELGRLDDFFPQEARTAIARAMLAGDLLAAFPEVYRIARAAPERAAAIATRLYPLPVLCIFHEAFRFPPPPIESGLPAPEKVWPIWARVFQGVLLIGFLYSAVDRSPSQDLPAVVLGHSSPQGLPAFQEVPNPPEPVDYDSIEFAMGEVCHPTLRTQGMEWFCMAAERTIQAMQRADCHAISSSSSNLRRELSFSERTPVPGVPPGGPRGLFQTIERRARMICGDVFK